MGIQPSHSAISAISSSIDSQIWRISNNGPDTQRDCTTACVCVGATLFLAFIVTLNNPINREFRHRANHDSAACRYIKPRITTKCTHNTIRPIWRCNLFFLSSSPPFTANPSCRSSTFTPAASIQFLATFALGNQTSLTIQSGNVPTRLRKTLNFFILYVVEWL